MSWIRTLKETAVNEYEAHNIISGQSELTRRSIERVVDVVGHPCCKAPVIATVLEKKPDYMRGVMQLIF